MKRQFRRSDLKHAFFDFFRAMGHSISVLAVLCSVFSGLIISSMVSPDSLASISTSDARNHPDLNPGKVPVELEGVTLKEHLGETIDLGLEFTSVEDGQKHKLGEYFQPGKPTLINLVYFECPMLCTMVLNGVSDGMKNLDLAVGKDFNVVTVSINPHDDLGAGKQKRKNYLEHYNTSSDMGKTRVAEQTEQGWHFFTGTEDQIKTLADQLGFRFRYDETQKQYAHPAATFILTPEGKISRYLYGIQYRPLDLRFALVEASRGRVGNVIDRLLMFCYHYDPSRRGYTLQATRVMQAGGLGTIAILGGYLTVFWTRQRKGKKKNDNAL